MGGGGRYGRGCGCGGELIFELSDALLELFGSLAVPLAGGFEIADADLQSFALGFAFGGLGLPGLA